MAAFTVPCGVGIHFVPPLSSALTLPSISSRCHGRLSRAPFEPHHHINEKPQNTSLVRYEIVCKANEEVINTLFFDRMRLPADGAWKVASPSLSCLAPRPA